ncbi:mechanosensitive ion channel protein 10-like [Mercurialis annua]|uniref:mechanosensitive ion channel protein 10-like n=1 Tax=Mercurialis annua TaxID=3986 RepID=UPI0024ACC567|nr:mechanosensitive ion channel protein 10-like [Mercurialis annua]
MAENRTENKELLITVPRNEDLKDSATGVAKMSPRCLPSPGKPPKIPQIDSLGGERSATVRRTANRELLITVPDDEELHDSASGLAKMSPRPSPGKPPKIPFSDENILTRRRTLARSMISKPKSRFGEQPLLVDASVLEDDNLANIEEHISRNPSFRKSLSRGSYYSKSGHSVIRTNSIAPHNAGGLSGRVDDEDDDDVEDVVKKVQILKEKNKKLGFKAVMQWLIFLCLLSFLIASFTAEKFEKCKIWGLEFWKWCVLAQVIFSGIMVTTWFMNIIVFLIERNYLLRKKVLYFVYGLKKSVQVFVWIGLVLLTWVLLFDCDMKRSKKARRILHGITWTLAALLIGSFLWMIKTLLLKILACSFHVNTFFDRIQESIFHQYVLQTLSGPPLIEEAEKIGKSVSMGQVSFRNTKKSKKKETKVIDMERIYTMKQEKVSAGTMKTLVDAITNSGLSTLSNVLDESVNGTCMQSDDNEIHNEMQAIAAAYHIFKNVAKPDSKYFNEEDLMRFMIREEVDLVFPLFEPPENGQIDRKSLTNWVIKVYNGRKALAHALCDTKTAVKQLNKVVWGVIIIVTIFIWVLLLEVASTKFIWAVATNILVVAFMMKKTCTTVFEALMFVFVAHPFDVGDRCVVDGMILLVEEMNILTTVFLKLDNEKVYYPNAILATKPISNFYRSPDMGEAIEFSIDFATSMEKIGLLKDKIKQYLENNPQHWYAGHGFVVREIENVNKLKMAVYCSQTINFQDWPVKSGRRSDFVFAIKTMLEDLGITYYFPPQQIHLRHIGPDAAIASKF